MWGDRQSGITAVNNFSLQSHRKDSHCITTEQQKDFYC